MANKGDISIKINVDNKQAERAVLNLGRVLLAFQTILDSNDKKQEQLAKKASARTKKEVKDAENALSRKKNLSKEEIAFAKALEVSNQKIRIRAAQNAFRLGDKVKAKKINTEIATNAIIKRLAKKGITLSEIETLRIRTRFDAYNTQLDQNRALKKLGIEKRSNAESLRETKRNNAERIRDDKRSQTERNRLLVNQIKLEISESKKGLNNFQLVLRRREQFLKLSLSQQINLANLNRRKIRQVEDKELKQRIAAQKRADTDISRSNKNLLNDKKRSLLQYLRYSIQQNKGLKNLEEKLDKIALAGFKLTLSEKARLRIQNLKAMELAEKKSKASIKALDKRSTSSMSAEERTKLQIFKTRLMHELRLEKGSVNVKERLNKFETNNFKISELEKLKITQSAERMRLQEVRRSSKQKISEEKKLTFSMEKQEKKRTDDAKKEQKKRDQDRKKSIEDLESSLKSSFGSINGSIQSIGSSINQYLIFGLQAATLTAAALSVQMIRIGAEFEQAVTTLGAIRGQSGVDLKPFEEQARLLGETTAFTATEAAKGMQELARAGMRTGDIIASSNSALKFAGANATNMTTSTTLLAATMAQFGLSASQSTRVVDVFTTALQNSLLNVDTLQVAMRYAGAVGSSFGRSLEETTAMVALFRDLGLEGSTAGTQFRQSFLRLASPTKKAKEALKKYKIELEDVNPRVNTFSEILQTLADTGIAKDLPAIKELVSIRAAGSFSKILSDVADGSSKLEPLLESFENSAAITETTYERMINTVQGQTDILKSVVEETFLRLFDIITMKGAGSNNPLINLLKSLQDIFKDLNIGIINYAERFQTLLSESGTEFIKYLENNSSTIAAGFINLINIIIKITKLIIDWREEIALLVKILLSIGAATAVIAGLGAVIKSTIAIVTAFKTVIAAAAARTALLSTAMLGPVGLVAGLVAAAAAFAAITIASNKYAESQRRIALQIDANKKGTRDYYKALDQLKVSSEDIKDVSTEILIDLAFNKESQEVQQSIQEELDAVSRLTEAQQREKIQKGEIVKINTVFGETLLSNLAIQKLIRTETGVNLGLEDKRSIVLQELSNSTERLGRIFREASVEQNQLLETSKNADGAFGNLSTQVEDSTKRLEEAETQYELSKSRLDDLKRSIEEASQEEERSAAITLARIEIQDQMNQSQEVANTQTEEQIDLLSLLNNALQARMDLEKEIADSKIEQFGTDQDKAIKAEKDRIREIERIFAEEFGLRDHHSEKSVALQKRLYDALQQDRANRNKEELDDLKDQLESLLNARLNSVESLRSENNKLQESIKSSYSSFLKQEIISLDTSIARLAEYYSESEHLLEQNLNDGLINTEQFNEKVQQLRESHLTQLDELEETSSQRSLEREEIKNNLLLKMSTDTNNKILKLQEDYANKFNKINIENIDSVESYSEALLELGKESSQAFDDFFKGEDLGQWHKIATKNAELQSQALLNLTNNLFETRDSTQEYTNSILAAVSSVITLSEANKHLIKTAKDLKDTDPASQAFLVNFRLVQMGITLKGVIDRVNNLADAVSDKLPSGFKEVFNLFRTGISATNQLRKQFLDFNDIVNNLTNIRQEGLFKGLFKSTLEGLDSIQSNWRNLKSNLKDISFWRELLKRAISFKDIFVSIGKAATQSAISISKISLDKMKSGLDFLTGGANFNPFEIINDSLSEFTKLSEEAAKKQEDLKKQLESGDITQSEFDEANTALQNQAEGTSPEQIQAFANDFVTKISDRIKMIAQVAGPVLQAIAAELPNLVQTFITEIPKIVSSLAAALPDFFFAILDGLTAVFDSLTQQIKGASSEAANAFFSELSAKFVSFIGSFAGFITTAIQQIVANLPQIIGGLTEIINGLVTAIGSIMTTLISSLPDIATALLDALVSIIDNLGPILRNIITSIADMLPDLLISIADAIPKLLGSLGRLLGDVLIGIASAMPKVITAIINAIPRIVTGLIEGAIEFVMAIVEAVPDIIIALVSALPDLIIALVTKFPRMVIELVALIIRKLPEIAFRLVMALLVELPRAILIAAGQFASEFVNGVKKFFKDAIQRIKDALNPFRNNKDKNKEDSKNASVTLDDDAKFGEKLGVFASQVGEFIMKDMFSFGDTPHPIKAGTEGLTARFASGDFVIAAQEPAELMRQSLMAMGGNLTGFLGNLSSSLNGPSQVPAMMSSGGGSSQVDIAVMADGRLLDAIQVRAMDNGNAPKMEKRIRRSSGATVGFNRGRFNKFGKR